MKFCIAYQLPTVHFLPEKAIRSPKVRVSPVCHSPVDAVRREAYRLVGRALKGNHHVDLVVASVLHEPGMEVSVVVEPGICFFTPVFVLSKVTGLKIVSRQ